MDLSKWVEFLRPRHGWSWPRSHLEGNTGVGWFLLGPVRWEGSRSSEEGSIMFDICEARNEIINA
jgi:hypothetical protein